MTAESATKAVKVFGNISLIALSEGDTANYRRSTQRSVISLISETMTMMPDLPEDVSTEARHLLEKLDANIEDRSIKEVIAGSISKEALSKVIYYSAIAESMLS